MRESWSATKLSSPQICCGMIEACSSLSICSRRCSLFLRCSVEANPFLMIYTTPVLSVNRRMHLFLISDLTASMAEITASSSLDVDPVYCYSLVNVLRANIVPKSCLKHCALPVRLPRWADLWCPSTSRSKWIWPDPAWASGSDVSRCSPVS